MKTATDWLRQTIDRAARLESDLIAARTEADQLRGYATRAALRLGRVESLAVDLLELNNPEGRRLALELLDILEVGD